MSERNGTTLGTGTAEIPVVRPNAEPTPVPGPQQEAAAEPNITADDDVVPGMQPTAPVSVRPRPRLPRRGPLTVMGPWAPVAGGLLGLVLGLATAFVLAGSAENFEDRFALVLTVLALGMLGTAGI